MKIVNKPWGYEKWIVQTGKYVLKEIFMKKGCKSSLQYHEVKEETIYILTGTGKMYYGTRPDRNFTGLDKPLSIQPLGGGVTYSFKPNTVHRVEALTDLTMIEVSTPEVDDCIRLKDDYGRGDGRIESEHKPIIGTDLNGNPLLKNPERY